MQKHKHLHNSETKKDTHKPKQPNQTSQQPQHKKTHTYLRESPHKNIKLPAYKPRTHQETTIAKQNKASKGIETQID